jgi:hypothetical protein
MPGLDSGSERRMFKSGQRRAADLKYNALAVQHDDCGRHIGVVAMKSCGLARSIRGPALLSMAAEAM